MPAGHSFIRGSAQSLLECRKAAAEGSPKEQLRLASRYREGDGVPQNLVQAYKWLLICEATVRGLVAQTRSMKAQVALRMANPDLHEAEQRALEFLKGAPVEARPIPVASEMPKPQASRVSA